MTDTPITSDFFVAGGTLRPNSDSYVQRPADDDLFRLTQEGKFCYVLTSRQMGKSSLMMRTARRLKEVDISTAIVDLTRIGTVAADQWYLGLISLLNRQLRLRFDVESWWAEHAALGPVQRFSDFLGDIVLTMIEGKVVIFVDEIDSTLNLDFTDDFFAAIRAMYNARVEDSAFNRLSFTFLGVAHPSDLIKDRSRTPFNVGEGIVLRDFSQQDANVLASGLAVLYSEQGGAIFDRIFYWTHGHPYLTQKLCLNVAEESNTNWTHERVDELVDKLFLSESDEARSETNLKFVRENISQHPDRRDLLALYKQVYQSKTVAEDERSLTQSRLKLFGLVRAEQGTLHVRNEIYRQAFNMAWIKQNTPADRTRQIAIGASVAVLVLVAVLGFFIWQGRQQTAQALAQNAEQSFSTSPSPDVRLNALADLFDLGGDHAGQARSLFNMLPTVEKLALFNSETAAPEDVRLVVQGTYITLNNTPENNDLLTAMRTRLEASEDVASAILANEIDRWLQGRADAGEADYANASFNYGVAIDLNDQNPATFFDRALARTQTEDYEGTLTDLDQVLSLDGTLGLQGLWQERLVEAVQTSPNLHVNLWDNQADHQAIAALVSEPDDTPTPTLTPTATPTDLPTNTSTPTALPDTPTPTPTLTSTPTPIPILPPEPVVNVEGGTYKLVFTKWDGGQHNVYVADTNGNNEQFILGRGTGPSWSPDGEFIYFAGEPGVDRQVRDGREYLLDGISNGLVRLVANPLPLTPRDLRLSQPLQWKQGTARWTQVSPNGQIVAYDARPGGDYRLYFTGAEGQPIPFEIVGEQGSWSPDGERLVYRSGRGGTTGIWISNQNDSGHLNLTSNGSDAFPTWSPDGKTIAFSRDEGGNTDVYTISIDGGNLQRLTDAPGPDSLPVYTPGGEIIFRSARDGGWAIWKMRPNGSNEAKIIPNASVGPDWTNSKMSVR